MEKSEYARALEILDRYIYYARLTRQNVIVNVSVFDYAKQKGNTGNFLPINLFYLTKKGEDSARRRPL